jgi:hypothetical protein
MTQKKTYIILFSDLEKIGYPNIILSELTWHCSIEFSKIEWPETFYVSIDLGASCESTNDTNGIQYFRDKNMTNPFLIMGYSDPFFYLIAAFLSLIGHQFEIL